jgi:hypothetical protein
MLDDDNEPGTFHATEAAALQTHFTAVRESNTIGATPQVLKEASK